MAKEFKTTEEGLNFSDSSDDEKDTVVEEEHLEPDQPTTEVSEKKTKKRKTSH